MQRQGCIYQVIDKDEYLPSDKAMLIKSLMMYITTHVVTRLYLLRHITLHTVTRLYLFALVNKMMIDYDLSSSVKRFSDKFLHKCFIVLSSLLSW